MAALQRQLDQARQALLDAYEPARAARYRPGSAEMEVLDTAERRYQRTRSRWQDWQSLEAGRARDGQGETGGQPDVVVDLTTGRQWIDLDGTRPAVSDRGLPEQRSER